MNIVLKMMWLAVRRRFCFVRDELEFALPVLSKLHAKISQRNEARFFHLFSLKGVEKIMPFLSFEKVIAEINKSASKCAWSSNRTMLIESYFNLPVTFWVLAAFARLDKNQIEKSSRQRNAHGNECGKCAHADLQEDVGSWKCNSSLIDYCDMIS